MQLIKALRYSHPSSLAFVGAGGKTTAIFRLAREFLASTDNVPGLKTVFVTTSTHFGAWQTKFADLTIKIDSISDIVGLGKKIPNGVVLLAGEENNNLLTGLAAVIIEKIKVVAQDLNIPLLIEADGSHTCPLKAPAEHEPAIPEFVQSVVVVAGLQGLGKPISKTWVHRPERFAELSGHNIGEIVTGDILAKVLLNKNGGLKNIPLGARRNVLLNQADTPELKAIAKRITNKLIPDYHSVIIASLSRDEDETIASDAHPDGNELEIHAVNEQIAGIILGAGGSSRFGEPKQLLEWKEKPLIRHVALTALKAGLSPVIVVIGANSADVESTINDLPLRIVNNPDWKDGMSKSIKLGIATLPDDVGGAVFIQADQPQIPSELIKSLADAHSMTLNPIIAPQIDGQRGNPVLFDTNTFPLLNLLEGDIGGRALFSRFPVQWVPWVDPNLLLDIDSPEDFQKFLRIYPDSKDNV